MAIELDTPEYTLEELLMKSPAGSFTLTDDDKEWLQIKPLGKEKD